ncbi:MAG TPA: NADAR family protein [Caulobacteraceae bacterium]|nr:NADAR family protein [Caulobacteraceae bacterium]
MQVRFRPGLLILAPEDRAEVAALSKFDAAHRGHVFQLGVMSAEGVVLHDLGARAEACKEPLNITSRSPGALKMISNFSETKFELDGAIYASVEGFWQGLKFPDEADRRRLAVMHGSKAKDAGYYAPKSDVISYGGQSISIGTWDHWRLMEAACTAKFEQCEAARLALRSTGNRPLTHQMRRDSRTIPGVILADIWMRLRRNFR